MSNEEILKQHLSLLPKLGDEERVFLLELRALTMKHGIAIMGCGCCDSPYLIHVQTGNECHGYSSGPDGENIRWNGVRDDGRMIGHPNWDGVIKP